MEFINVFIISGLKLILACLIAMTAPFVFLVAVLFIGAIIVAIIDYFKKKK